MVRIVLNGYELLTSNMMVRGIVALMHRLTNRWPLGLPNGYP